jgi:nitrite reductase/ring-hydroxylating ferredoxin subunit
VTVSHEWSAPVADITPGGSAKFPVRFRGRRLEGFLVNFEGRFRAYVNYCVHAGTPLDWWPNEFFTEDGQLLICATHGALFVPDTGQCAGGPCGEGRLYALAVRVEADRVIVTTDDGHDGNDGSGGSGGDYGAESDRSGKGDHGEAA